MQEDFSSRAWADHHGAVSDSLDALFAQVRVAFQRLAARTYDAPWRRKTNEPRARFEIAPRGKDEPASPHSR